MPKETPPVDLAAAPEASWLPHVPRLTAAGDLVRITQGGANLWLPTPDGGRPSASNLRLHGGEPAVLLDPLPTPGGYMLVGSPRGVGWVSALLVLFA